MDIRRKLETLIRDFNENENSAYELIVTNGWIYIYGGDRVLYTTHCHCDEEELIWAFIHGFLYRMLLNGKNTNEEGV